MWRWLGSGLLVSTLFLGAVAAQQPFDKLRAAPSIVEGHQTQPPVTAQKPPVFRAGAHYVRVDAYPTTKDGKIVEGLTRDDFEIYEDGKPQAIESAEFITFDTWTPDAERKDPRTQQDAYDLAADPGWRVFVIVIDRTAYGMEGQHYMRGPLHEFLERNLGPRDLFGLLSTESSWTDLTLGQTTTSANAVIDSRQWINPPEFDERYLLYYECGLGSLIARKRLDETYELLEGLVKLLGLVRQEKKNIVFVTNGLQVPGPVRGDAMTMPDMPKIGITNGRVGEVPRAGDRTGGPSRSSLCAAERMRLTSLDFGQRFRDLLVSARQGNVAFYPISPAGLQGMPFFERGGVNMGAYHAQNARADTLRTLASETDGIAIVNTNNLAGGMRRIADDLHAYYVLGYYTTNTNWDGRVRSIKVRLKPKRDTIRARRQYRAPTQQEIAALSAGSVSAASTAPPSGPSPVDLALRGLDRPATEPAASSAPTALLGQPRASRMLPRTSPQPVDVLHFGRTERMRIEWTVSGALDRRTVRVLDRTGKPLRLEVPVVEDDNGRMLTVELPLAAFAPADYIIELQAASGSIVARSLLAFRVR